MGLFSSKKITTVASTVYNLAGDVNDRPNYLKSLVLRNLLSGTKEGLGTTLTRGMIKGPGQKFRSYYRWAETKYTAVGIPAARLYDVASIDSDFLAPHVPVPASKTAWVQDVTVAKGDYSRWIEQYIFNNYPSLINNEYESFIDRQSPPLITINFSNSSVGTVQFYATDFSADETYIYAYYNEVTENQNGPVNTGPTTNTGNSLYDTSDWSYQDQSSLVQSFTLNKQVTTTKSYSDGRPNEGSVDNTSTPASFNQVTKRYVKLTPTGSGTDPDRDTVNATREIVYVTEKRKKINQSSTATRTYMEGTVTVTESTLTTEEVLIGDNDYRIDNQNVILSELSSLKIYIYRVGSGNPTLDNAIDPGEDLGQFYPIIPVRLNNSFVQNSGDLGTQAFKAYKKATGSKLSELQDKLSENDNLDDIDDAFVVLGVSLNVKDNSAKKYIWEFFTFLMNNQKGGISSYAIWKAKNDLYESQLAIWKDWKEKGGVYGGSFVQEPVKPKAPSGSFNFINANPNNPALNYEAYISWAYITKQTGFGKGKPGAKNGELWFTTQTGDPFGRELYTKNITQTNEYANRNIIKLWRQVSADYYEVLEIRDMSYGNVIKNNQGTGINAYEALNLIGTDFESGFIIPLHASVYKQLSLKDANQTATACCMLVLNSYEVKKQRWYERGFFKFLFVIVLAIVSVIFTGGAGIGILGAHMAIGGALGLTGLAAAIVGSIVNALAAMVVTTMIEKAMGGLGAFGAVFGAILGVFLAGGLGNLQNGFASLNWGNLLRVDNLIKLTSAVGDSYAKSIYADIQKMGTELTDFLKTAEAELERVKKLYSDNFSSNPDINPMMFVDAARGIKYESRDTFLARTLMTGSEVADMSNGMISEFAGLSLELDTAFS